MPNHNQTIAMQILHHLQTIKSEPQVKEHLNRVVMDGTRKNRSNLTANARGTEALRSAKKSKVRPPLKSRQSRRLRRVHFLHCIIFHGTVVAGLLCLLMSHDCMQIEVRIAGGHGSAGFRAGGVVEGGGKMFMLSIV